MAAYARLGTATHHFPESNSMTTTPISDALISPTLAQPLQRAIPNSGAEESAPVFARRWKLADDGFGLQRDDSGNYVHIDDALSVLHAALAPPESCATCGEEMPFTGSCGTSRSDTRALCNRAQPVQPAVPPTLSQAKNIFNEQERMALWKEFNYSDRTIATITLAVLKKLGVPVAQSIPPLECKTDGEKNAFAFGWWKALETARNAIAQPVQPPGQTCRCETCVPQGDFNHPENVRMIVCGTCGNKRCPRAFNHLNACTNSNDVGQKGSSWEHVLPFFPKPAVDIENLQVIDTQTQLPEISAHAKDDTAVQAAWLTLKPMLQTASWTVSDSFNYRGFFAWGWEAHRQHDAPVAQTEPKL